MIAESTAVPAPQTDEAVEQPQKSGKHRVLVVEDEIPIADLLVILLERSGYEVEVATEGYDALRVALKFEPELILLDIMLPGIDGFEVTRQLRFGSKYAPYFRQTRILYLTAHQHILRQRFKALPDTPVSDWILKPFNPKELLEKVARVFADKEAGRA